MNLFDVAAEYREAAETLANLDLDEETVFDTLEGLSGALEAKAQSVVCVVRNIEALAEAVKGEERRLKARREALEARAESMRKYVLQAMSLAGVQKIETPLFKIAPRLNPESVEVFDVKQIPAEYMQQPEPPPPAPDKEAIKAAIKEGKDVPGALLTRTQRLSIT